MSPAEIDPGVPVHISESLDTLLQAIPTKEKVVVDRLVYVLPVGAPLKWYVKVDACKDSSITVLYSARTAPGYKEEVPSVMATEKELNDEIGRSEQKIDRVKYTAVDPIPAP